MMMTWTCQLLSKCSPDNWASNGDVRSRFLAEARILRRIHDRRLVQVYDIGTFDDPAV